MVKVLILLCLWQGATHKDNPPAHAIHQDSGNQDDKVKPPSAPVYNPASSVNTDQNSKENRKDPTPDWILVWITGIYTIVSGLTLWAIWHQNRSTQNAERAVLIPQWDNMVHINPEHKNGDPLSHCFQWTFANWGKGPAFIDETFAEMALIDAIESLPTRPKFGKPKHFMGDPVPPGKAFEPGFYAPMKETRSFEIVEAEYRTGGKILYVYGFVRYRDMFGRPHETRFGLRYRAAPELRHEYDGFLMDGPKAYNKYK
jgi:hypothetical protein